jgi:hypothetical protein
VLPIANQALYTGGVNAPLEEGKTSMRTIMAVAVTGALAVWLASPAFAAKVVTKNGTYEGGCTSSSCLYKPMKTKRHAKTH